MPYREFQVNEVLTAANVNTFLMNQAVMTFADSTARAAALGTPIAGMVTFLADSTAVQVYSGSTAIGWTEISGGGGNVANDVIQPNLREITENFTFEDGQNGVSAGPVTIASGATVTVGTASAWSIV
jgi:hypothetical protein